ncbi:AbrB family transcriptional regulator [Bifidobacterium gallicum]|uniref:AbrB family transcriptional regulator n=1 Tax=Bifidobacterium gallicum DSM 20093 = LMG 11596 TaxID=561180 RepID=D1NVE9_9BIFI|nr:AbrB family transcriptional regulator [Bifidobacterium gallicum]EFA22800.1 leucine rich repeat variant [Bifidobacterium gallicum DSM 20093 = LMG 11596]KFI59738.1 AbrB family transcriptional regulator [Bifidobacterium gallicum DSM 20093 = LMG 11596]
MADPQEHADLEQPVAEPADAATPQHDTESEAAQFEPLTATYEHLRHSENADELHDFAVRELPDRADLAAFSRATALLEAVAGNEHTPVEDRVHLAQTMPFPNVLVKLSQDAQAQVRQAVASNTDCKNWLVGRLTKDDDAQVRSAALHNPQTSWKMRLEGAQNPDVDAQTLDFLGKLGVEIEPSAPMVLSTMVRRAVALNPSTSQETITRLANDGMPEVARAARSRL